MKDDDVLETLSHIGDHVRRERADDAALEAVARGESASASEAVRALEERAKREPETAAMVAASRPSGDAAVERVVARVGAKANANAKADANAKANAKGGRLIALVRRASVVVAPLAVAAAVVLYLGRGGGSREALPEYSVVASGEKDTRGADEAQARLELRGGEGATFEIVARPGTDAGAHVVAYVFAIGEGEPNPVDAKVEVAFGGSVRIRGRARALDGAREVRVVLGSTSDFKRFEDALSHAREGKSDARVRVLTVPIVRVKP